MSTIWWLNHVECWIKIGCFYHPVSLGILLLLAQVPFKKNTAFSPWSSPNNFPPFCELPKIQDGSLIDFHSTFPSSIRSIPQRSPWIFWWKLQDFPHWNGDQRGHRDEWRPEGGAGGVDPGPRSRARRRGWGQLGKNQGIKNGEFRDFPDFDHPIFWDFILFFVWLICDWFHPIFCDFIPAIGSSIWATILIKRWNGSTWWI